jgi:hypothetical protein
LAATGAVGATSTLGSRREKVRYRHEGAIEHDTDDGRFSTQQRTCGRSVAALGEQNIGKLYRKIRKSADDSLLQLLPSFTQFN